ncbi:hypothetical protein DH2020_027565 [Rehmannia glutinosa]|uniref:Disease resistance protein n=1 Tax=Rehmannia glutinosa TaxID=99300 RepID=A0ABR0VTW1_REHGL
MAEAAVGAVVGASIRILLQNLLSVSSEISLVRAFNKDLENLKDSFLMIQDFLDDAEKQQITNRAVNRWLKKLESLAFEADNVLDELNYHLLSKKIETQNTMKKKVQSFFSHSNPIALRRKMAHKIRDINKKLELINQEASSFGLQIRLAGAQDSGVGSGAPASPGTDSFTVDPIVLGREYDVSRIVEMLTTNPNEQVFKIVPIFGMGGLGKTTLARLVFGDEQIKTHFEHCIWVHVSRNFNVLMIFKNILASLTTENVELGNREVLLKKLQKDLGAKRYLLVLDDVWNEETERWDDFVNSLVGISSVRGNGIIVTTRSERVASIVKTLPIYELKSLSEDNCWSIIKAKAFRTGDVPLEFEKMGKILQKDVKSWLSDFGGDGNTILKILKLSFDHLSSPSLKKCFAYCSIFPKGVYIEREELIELWMAEGFLLTDQKMDTETVGNKFLGILLENSLLQVVERDLYGNITYCNMHDLVHDLACSVLDSKSICLNNNILDDIYQVRYICREYIRDESYPIPKEQARCLRTLFFVGKVSDIIFSELKCLHVLILMGRDVKELPSMIRELIHLRYLDISYTRIECLPDSIGELYHLQTIRAVTDDKSEYYLLISLETLPYFKVGHEKGYGIVELGSMKNLKGKLEIHGLENVHDKEDAMSAYLFQKRNVFKLKFVWDESREGETNDEDVLEGLQPHPNLKSLEIYGFKGKRFPLWILKMVVRDDLEGRWLGLNNLMEIKLTSCKECEDIPMLGHLPLLKYLYLCRLTNVRSIGSSFYGIESCSTPSSSNIGVRKKDTVIVFQALERLELSDMPNLTQWVEVELPIAAKTQVYQVMVFPCLDYVKIDNCRLLTSAPSHFPCLKELEIAEMDSGIPLANICGIKLISLTKLKIDRLDGLASLPDGLFKNNQNLSYLEIRDCPNLTRLVRASEVQKLLFKNC